jgi:hypothetical protein
MNTYNEKDDERLEPILNEIRSIGTPYSDEPDPRYWSNFRVRVMERVEAEELKHQPIGKRLWQWITERPLRSGLIGFSAAALVLVGVLTNPFSSEKHDVAVVQPPVPVQHQDTTIPKQAPALHIAPAVKAPVDVQVAKDMAATNKAVRKMLNSKEYANNLKDAVTRSEETKLADAGQQSERVSTVTAADSELPVSLSDLSESLLESLLHSLETTK